MCKSQTTKNKILAAQQGTGARGEQYLDGRDRSHTMSRRGFVLGPQHRAPKFRNNKNSLTGCPFFRSKRTTRTLLYIAFIALSRAVAAEQINDSGRPWRATVNVVDESRQPIKNAEITIGYYVPAHPGETISTDSIKGFTDTNGVFIGAGVTRSTDLFFGAGKAGYYRSRLEYELGPLFAYNPTHWNPNVTLILRAIGKPIPMYAKRVESKFPELTNWIGFDLMIGDWVAPNGSGKVTDFLLRTYRKVLNDHDYDASLELSFPNQGDGIQVAEEETATGSTFKTARTAPVTGYESNRVWRYTNSIPSPVNGYLFRVRTLLDENGSVKSCLYGKIRGDFRYYVGTRSPQPGIGFDYYMNPAANDQNLEFDPKHNLITALKVAEQIKEP